MKKVKAIFFDWGLTFVKGFRKERNKEIDKILRPFGIGWKKFNLLYWRPFYILRSAGKIKSDKDFEIAIQRAAKKKIPVRKIIEVAVKSQIIPSSHVGIVQKLRKNYKVGILSNNVENWVRKVMKNYRIENLFDAVIISSRVKARKPNALIYYQALKKLRVNPEESIFVADEVAEDLVAASGLGMKTIWLKTKEKSWWKESDDKILKIYQPDAIVKNLKEIIPIIESYDNQNF